MTAAMRDGNELLREQAGRAATRATRAANGARVAGTRAGRTTGGTRVAGAGSAGLVARVERLGRSAHRWWAERDGGPEQQARRPQARQPRVEPDGELERQARQRWDEPDGGLERQARQRWDQRVAEGERMRRAEEGPRHLAGSRLRRLGWSEDLTTGWCSLLLVLGLYLEGWSQRSLPAGGAGPSLTPWHWLCYGGLAATAAWILTREQRRGAWSLQAVPPGYRLALVGVGLALVALAGDAVWHSLAGGTTGLARLVAPFHLGLFAGVCLLAGSMARAAWSGPTSARVPGLRAFWQVVLSTTLVVAATAFFFQDLSPVAAWRRSALATLPAGSPFAETVPTYDLVGLLVHNLLFVAPVLLLLLRWQTPLGTFTVLAGSVALLSATQNQLGLIGLAGAAVLGGAAADVAVVVLRPSPQRRGAARAVAALAPAVYWTAHFALLAAGYGASLELERWLGSVVWASLSGCTLALLMWPPAVPLTAWNRSRRPRPAAPSTPMPARMVGR